MKFLYHYYGIILYHYYGIIYFIHKTIIHLILEIINICNTQIHISSNNLNFITISCYKIIYKKVIK